MSLMMHYESPIDGPSSALDMELDLSAFPAPPSHIPRGSPPSLHRSTSASAGAAGDRSSIISNNPPPSHPPSSPLPPLPLSLPRTSSAMSVLSLAQQQTSEFGALKGRSRSGSVLSASVGPGVSAASGSGSGRAPLKIRTDFSSSSGFSSARPSVVRSPTSASVEGQSQNQGPRSPTGSVYSITVGRSAAESLRERVGGLLSLAPAAVSSSATSTGVTSSNGMLGVSNAPTRPTRPISPAVLPFLAGADHEHAVSLLTAEELNLERDPVLARALSPMTMGLGESEGDVDLDGLIGKPSLSSLGRRPGVGIGLPTHSQQQQQLAQRMGTGHQVKGSSESGVGLGPSLTRVSLDTLNSSHAHASGSGLASTSGSMISSARAAPPSAFRGGKFGSSSSSRRGSSGSNTSSVSRTMSQSRKKPLPGLPGGDEGDEDEELHERGEGAASPDIASIISATPRPQRTSSTSRRSSRTKSGRSVSVGSSSVRSSSTSAAHGTSTPRSRERSRENLSYEGAPSDPFASSSSSSIGHPRPRMRPPLPEGAEERVRLSRASSAGTSRLSAFSASSGESGGTSGGYLSFSAAAAGAFRRARAGAGGETDGDRDTEEAYAGMYADGDAMVEGDEAEFDPDMSADYGVAFARHRGAYDLSPNVPVLDDEMEGGRGRTVGRENVEVDREGEQEEEEGEKSASDSDIDLHTPLPQILLREGVLSPHSKVLSNMTSNGSLGSMSSIGGRESVASNMTSASLTSVMTKNGLFKDERDTDRRRRRHRDGRLLREGLGLTTGLGWSDSEDEGAPSPLTNRLSSLALSRNASLASFRSNTSSGSGLGRRLAPARPKLNGSKSYYGPPGEQRGKPIPHPLSKSMSAHALAASGVKSAPTSARNSGGNEGDADLEYVLNKGAMGPPSAPPYAHAHAYQKQQRGVPNYSLPLSPDLDSSNRGSVASSSGASAASGHSRASPSPPSAFAQGKAKKRKGPTSTGSAASVFSLTVSIPEGEGDDEAIDTSRRRHQDRTQSQKQDQRRSTSPAPTSGTTSSSSTSLPYPPTPLDDDPATATSSSYTSASTMSGGTRSKTPVASRMQVRSRAFSSSRSAPASSVSFPPETVPLPPVPSTPSTLSKASTRPSAMTTPRPLRLPALHQRQGNDEEDGKGNSKPALQPGQPQSKPGSLLGYNRQLHDRQRMAASSSSSSAAPSALPAPQTPVRPSYATSTTPARPTRSYGSLGSSSGLHAPSTVLTVPPPSPGVPRSSSPLPSPGARPRTGTGMVYRQSSLPAPSSSAYSTSVGKAGLKSYGRI